MVVFLKNNGMGKCQVIYMRVNYFKFFIKHLNRILQKIEIRCWYPGSSPMCYLGFGMLVPGSAPQFVDNGQVMDQGHDQLFQVNLFIHVKRMQS
jgi:hypothetical protein